MGHGGPSYAPLLLQSKFSVDGYRPLLANRSFGAGNLPRQAARPPAAREAAPLPGRRACAGGPAAHRRRGPPRRAACAPRWPRTTTWCPTTTADAGPTRYGGLVFDATGITQPAGLKALYEFFTPLMRNARRRRAASSSSARRRGSGQPARADRPAGPGGLHPQRRQGDPARRDGAAGLRLPGRASRPRPASSPRCASCCPAKSAYVDGQVIRVGAGRLRRHPPTGTARSTGKVAVVTGAARGIGATIAEVLARDGAQVVCVDVPQAAGEACRRPPTRSAAPRSTLDVTAADAADKLAEHLLERHGGARHRRPQRRHHPRQDARQHGRGRAGTPSIARQPACPAADHRRAARQGRAQRGRPRGRRRPRSPASPATAARPTTRTSKAGVIGLVAGRRARCSPTRASPSTPSRRASSRPR